MVLICGQERGPTGDAAGPYCYNSELAMILSEMLYISRDARPPFCTAVTNPQERGGKKMISAISYHPP
jgi:hypothetical protein